jgi:uncharacterized protein
MKYLLRLARIVALVYLGLLMLLAGCQNRLLYYPTRDTEPKLLKQASLEGLDAWRNPQGEIVGWHLRKPTAKKRLVVFHGNAGYALHRSFYAEGFAGHDFEVYLFEYPGYGARPGSPGKDVFLSTGRAVVDQLLTADSRPLYLLGESIGGGTACALAAALPDKIAGVVLVVPFARLVEVAKWHFPYLPVGLLLRDRYDNIASLEKYHGPIAMVVAECDEVVSPEQGRKLHAAYAGPKLLVSLPDCGHNGFPTNTGADWWQTVTNFLGQNVAQPIQPAAGQ